MTFRIKDIDFDALSITVRAAKGNKDWVTLLPEVCIPELPAHLLKVAQLHQADKLQGNGFAPMPNALYRKYPSASRELGLPDQCRRYAESSRNELNHPRFRESPVSE